MKLVSELLMDVMGEDVFDKPPELERAHRSLDQKPQEGQLPRPLVVCFHRFQEKKKVLHWVMWSTRDVSWGFTRTCLRVWPRNTQRLKASSNSSTRRKYDLTCCTLHNYEFSLTVRHSSSSHPKRPRNSMTIGSLLTSNISDRLWGIVLGHGVK